MCDQPFAVHAIYLSLSDAAPKERCCRLELLAKLKELVAAVLSMLLRASLEPPVIYLAWTIR